MSSESENKAVRCDLCPHHCLLREGKRGICGSRLNRNGQIVSEVYGHPCALAIDPIEKKPLAEFHPHTYCLSLACTGCNLRCIYCQNHEISQVLPGDVPSTDLSPEQVVETALRNNLPGIAYTYTEPLTWIEYVSDIARLAHQHHLWNVLVTAGYVCQEPLSRLLPYIDAANVDLKSFSDDIYNKVNGARLQPVLDTLLAMQEAGVWVEITNLVIPGINDDMVMISEMCHWLVSHGFSRQPLHFTRFFPCYKLLSTPMTPLSTLKQAREVAHQAGMEKVYLGNV